MDILTIIWNYFILIYSVIISVSYLALGIISAFQLIYYKRLNRSTDYNVLLHSPNAPSISVLAPAFNECKSIVDNIRALLAIHYSNYEVIVINDGSTDNTMETIIKEFKLVKTNFAVCYTLETKEIKGVYKSTDDAFRFLTVIDKENGGKADALNAGLNISNKDYFMAIDVDSVIEPDALQKLAKPFLDNSGIKVIAAGGVIRIANSCKIVDGQLVDIEVPKNLLARFQVIEYARAFLIGRIAWSKMNGLLLVSGALGLFDKRIAIDAGGYLLNTVGEDMELVVRMRRHMYEKKTKHRVEYIPDPLCWTEAPTQTKTFGRQRNRWMRGTMDTLLIHRKLFFNPKYKTLGVIGYPFWLFFEWMAPIIEVLGLAYMVFLIFMGSINWPFFIFLFIFVYSYAVALSIYAILYEEFTFHKYNKVSHIIKLMLTAFVEPISYHFLNLYYAIGGNISFFRKDKSWGAHDRKGFSAK